MGLAAGCAPRAAVELRLPVALERSEELAVPRPETWGVDPDVLQRAVVEGLRAAGFAKARAGGAGRGRYTVTLRSELMERLYENGFDVQRRFTGERVRAELELVDRDGSLLYRSVLIESLSTSLTEARVAAAFLRGLED